MVRGCDDEFESLRLFAKRLRRVRHRAGVVASRREGPEVEETGGETLPARNVLSCPRPQGFHRT
jgi:hypothetical protein